MTIICVNIDFTFKILLFFEFFQLALYKDISNSKKGSLIPLRLDQQEISDRTKSQKNLTTPTHAMLQILIYHEDKLRTTQK